MPDAESAADDLYAPHAYQESSHCSHCGFRDDLGDCLDKRMHSPPYGDRSYTYAPHAFRPINECARCGLKRANGNVHLPTVS